MVSRLLLHRAHCFRRARLGQPLLSTRRRLIGEEERLIGDDSIAADRADHAGGVAPVGYNTNDTPEALAAREIHEEHQVYVDAVAALCADRIVWREDGVATYQELDKSG
ncbi:hypothetical protein GQ55_9G052600 [Panicum hallii var. hallii]|uniref:Uncharacterized protein n=1 Tax=Panicum hallii var. hallii TaxID=1504633 RepID=A0A2T7BZU2_9POAL|nr:hypothetical protein GQ55_9G052600 [Panicum hallii var. hallii]